MGYPTNIEWTDASWSPIGGCSVHSPGCSKCYAMRLAGTRLKHHPLYAGTTDPSRAGPVFNGHLTISPPEHPVWTWPSRWRGARAPRLGASKPSLIFVGDMSDLFHEGRDPAHIGRVFEAMAASVCLGRNHIFQLLTKRPEVMLRTIRGGGCIPETGSSWGIHERAWLGFSAERQQEFDERWPHMRELAAMGFQIFVSYEPALGPLSLPRDFLALGGRAWVIAGSESGRGAREFDREWFDFVREQCDAAGIPFFQKQITTDGRKVPIEEWPAPMRTRQFPEISCA